MTKDGWLHRHRTSKTSCVSTVQPQADYSSIWWQRWGGAIHPRDSITHQTNSGNTSLLFGCRGSDFSPHMASHEKRTVHVECLNTLLISCLFFNRRLSQSKISVTISPHNQNTEPVCGVNLMLHGNGVKSDLTFDALLYIQGSNVHLVLPDC